MRLVRSLFAGLALPVLLAGLGCVSGDQLKKVEDEVTDLKLEVFKLRSQMEEANKKADEESAAASEARGQDRRFRADLQENLRQLQETTRILGSRLGTPSVSRPAAVKPGAVVAAPEPPAASSDEDKAFNAAVLDYNRGNYAVAADGLNLFLKANPQSARKPDGLFYLGLCYYNQKQYDKAMPEFEQILREHPSSSQFLPAKLKRAQCLQRMGLKPAAIKAFKEITDGFPGSPEARTAQAELSDLGF
jgi:tol-pal system protein YbgF